MITQGYDISDDYVVGYEQDADLQTLLAGLNSGEVRIEILRNLLISALSSKCAVYVQLENMVGILRDPMVHDPLF